MPYTGFLISPTAKWLEAIASRMNQWNIFWSQFPLQNSARGDPIFIAGEGGCIIFHTHLNRYNRESLLKAWEKYAAAMPFAEEELATPFAQIEASVMMLYELQVVAPPLAIEPLGIDYRDSEVQPLSAEEVLAVLRALPPSSQTAWTQRVVARSNDLRVDT